MTDKERAGERKRKSEEGREKREARERMTERVREPAIYSRKFDSWLIGYERRIKLFFSACNAQRRISHFYSHTRSTCPFNSFIVIFY